MKSLPEKPDNLDQIPESPPVPEQTQPYGWMALAEDLPVDASPAEIETALNQRGTRTQEALKFLEEKKLGRPQLHAALRRHLAEVKTRQEVLKNGMPERLGRLPYAEHFFSFKEVPQGGCPVFWFQQAPLTEYDDKSVEINRSNLTGELDWQNGKIDEMKHIQFLWQTLIGPLFSLKKSGVAVDKTCERWMEALGHIDIEKTANYTGTEYLHMEEDVLLYYWFEVANKFLRNIVKDPKETGNRKKILEQMERADPSQPKIYTAIDTFIEASPKNQEQGTQEEKEEIADVTQWYRRIFGKKPPFTYDGNNIFLMIPGEDYTYFGTCFAEIKGNPRDTKKPGLNENAILILSYIREEITMLANLKSHTPLTYTTALVKLFNAIKVLSENNDFTESKWPQVVSDIREWALANAPDTIITTNQFLETITHQPQIKFHIDEPTLYYHLLAGLARAYEASAGQLDLMREDHRDLLRNFLTKSTEPNKIDIDQQAALGILDRADTILNFSKWVTEKTKEIEEKVLHLLEWTEQCGIPNIEEYTKALKKNLAYLRGKINRLENDGPAPDQNDFLVISYNEVTEETSPETCAGIWAKPTAQNKENDVNDLEKIHTSINAKIEDSKNPDDLTKALKAAATVFWQLRDVRGACKLKGIEWKSTHPPDKGLDKRIKVFPKSTVHISEPILAYRLIKNLNTAVGSPGRDPLNKSDRDATWEEIKTSGESGGSEVLKELFEQADHLFPSEFQDFKRITEFARANFKPTPPTTKREKRREGKSRLEAHHTDTQMEADIQASIEACRAWAVYVPQDIKGFIGDLEEIRQCAKITRCYIEHDNPEGIVLPPNIKCHGTFEMEFGKITHRLEWHLTPDAELVLQINGENHGANRFTGNELKAFYLELKHIVVKGLEGRLIRDFNEMETEVVRHLTGGRIARTLKMPGLRGVPVIIRPRVDKLFQGGGGKHTEKTDQEPGVPLMTARVKKALECLANGTPIRESFLAPLTLYIKKIVTTPDGRTVELHIPGKTTEILMAVHNGEYALKDVYLNTLTRSFAKAGYAVQTEVTEEGEKVHRCKPRQQSEEAKERYGLLKQELGIELSAEGLKNRTQITIPQDVEAVILDPPEDLPEAAPIRIELTEILAFMEAVEQGGTPEHDIIEAIEADAPQAVDELRAITRSRIHRVAFRAPQNPQFRKGSFISLETAFAGVE